MQFISLFANFAKKKNLPHHYSHHLDYDLRISILAMQWPTADSNCVHSENCRQTVLPYSLWRLLKISMALYGLFCLFRYSTTALAAAMSTISHLYQCQGNTNTNKKVTSTKMNKEKLRYCQKFVQACSLFSYTQFHGLKFAMNWMSCYSWRSKDRKSKLSWMLFEQ